MNEIDIVQLTEDDPWMMDILRVVRELNLPDWWIGAGFVRSKVWDYLHGYRIRTPLPDIDIIYLDRNDSEKNDEEIKRREANYEQKLHGKIPEINWSVTNQVRMHKRHGDRPYKSSEDALAQWVETATCVGVRLDGDKVVLTAPHGIEDLVNLILRPTFATPEGLEEFHKRVQSKEWLKKWPKLTIVT